MKVLHLTLKRQWFDRISSGEKLEEYREIKDYWAKRFSGSALYKGIGNGLLPDNPNTYFRDFYPVSYKSFDIVSANNGYQKNCPNIKWKHRGIRVGTGREEWGAVPGKLYFILDIGEIIK